MHAAISRARRLKTIFFKKNMHARPEKMRCTNLVRIHGAWYVNGDARAWIYCMLRGFFNNLMVCRTPSAPSIARPVPQPLSCT